MRYLEKTKTSGIGGYFELELPQASHSLFSKFLRFQSARAAFFALLQAERPNRVWIPNYICNAMIDPLQKLNITHSFYNINNKTTLPKYKSPVIALKIVLRIQSYHVIGFQDCKQLIFEWYI